MGSAACPAHASLSQNFENFHPPFSSCSFQKSGESLHLLYDLNILQVITCINHVGGQGDAWILNNQEFILTVLQLLSNLRM
jgi:hypothetical protein